MSVRQASLDVTSQGKVECRAGKTGNLPGGLFGRATISFSVFTLVMISVAAIYYKYATYYLIFTFLCMKYSVIEWIWKIFVIICDYLQTKESRTSSVRLQCGRCEIICWSLIHLCWGWGEQPEWRKAQCVPVSHRKEIVRFRWDINLEWVLSFVALHLSVSLIGGSLICFLTAVTVKATVAMKDMPALYLLAAYI